MEELLKQLDITVFKLVGLYNRFCGIFRRLTESEEQSLLQRIGQETNKIYELIDLLEDALFTGTLSSEQVSFFNKMYLSIVENSIMLNDFYKQTEPRNARIIDVHNALLQNFERLERATVRYNKTAPEKLVSPLQVKAQAEKNIINEQLEIDRLLSSN